MVLMFFSFCWASVCLLAQVSSFMCKFSLVMFWLTGLLFIFYSWFLHVLRMNVWLVQGLGVVLLMYFVSVQVWWLIFWFELSLLPIVLVILGLWWVGFS